MMVGSADLWPWLHFPPKEMTCPGGPVHPPMAVDLMWKLEAWRAAVGTPLWVTSGFRTPEHNAAVGGTEGSYHLKGMAADVGAEPHEMMELSALAYVVGFTGWKCYPDRGFIHVDIRPGGHMTWS